jgi:hypothetical protein
MKPENWITLGSLLLTALMTAIGLYLGPKLAVRRSLEQNHSQTILTRKIDVYQQLIGDMSELLEYYSDSFTASIMGLSKTKSETIATAQRTLERNAGAGGFIISQAAEDALKRTMSALSERNYDSTQEAYDSISAALHENLEKLKQCAREDCTF